MHPSSQRCNVVSGYNKPFATLSFRYCAVTEITRPSTRTAHNLYRPSSLKTYKDAHC